jgi:hypothetical protein
MLMRNELACTTCFISESATGHFTPPKRLRNNIARANVRHKPRWLGKFFVHRQSPMVMIADEHEYLYLRST